MKYQYDESRFPQGSIVLVKGDRDPHAGQEGEVVRADTAHKFWVKISGELFLKWGKSLRVVSLGAGKAKQRDEGGVIRPVRDAYKQFRERNPSFRSWPFVR